MDALCLRSSSSSVTVLECSWWEHGCGTVHMHVSDEKILIFLMKKTCAFVLKASAGASAFRNFQCKPSLADLCIRLPLPFKPRSTSARDIALHAHALCSPFVGLVLVWHSRAVHCTRNGADLHLLRRADIHEQHGPTVCIARHCVHELNGPDLWIAVRRCVHISAF